jgi:hypothetical protein
VSGINMLTYKVVAAGQQPGGHYPEERKGEILIVHKDLELPSLQKKVEMPDHEKSCQ